MHSYYSTTYFYVKTSYFDFINLAVGQRMNEIRRFGFLVTDSESLTQCSTTEFWQQLSKPSFDFHDRIS